MNIVILGLSITSSWGNGHAITYRGLVRGLVRRGHSVLFLERDVPWYASNRDLPHPPYGRTELYDGLDHLREEFTEAVQNAELVIVGSYVPEGASVVRWVLETVRGATAFYDIDTPITFSALNRGECFYLEPDSISRLDFYLSFTGGPLLKEIEQRFSARAARPLYCSADPEAYSPEEREVLYDLGYMGTYSADRQPKVEELLVRPAGHWPSGRFALAGPQYPQDLQWPSNIHRIEHLPPRDHRSFYNSQRFTLNITRSDMIRCGYSPSIRLFEAAACATPIISDNWNGLEEFFEPGKDLFVANSAEDVLRYLTEMPEDRLTQIGACAREKVLNYHTPAHRAEQLEQYLLEVSRS